MLKICVSRIQRACLNVYFILHCFIESECTEAKRKTFLKKINVLENKVHSHFYIQIANGETTF